MSAASVLNVENLGKAFRHYDREFERVLSWFGFTPRSMTETWVLRDIGFEVAAGEALAIVGQNGAGKSTLMKLITGTLRASEGRVDLKGRVSAILELGMGFNPDMTGRENVLQAGGLLGYHRQALLSEMDAIADFAEIGDFFDQPMRVYSSGMHMRVAFALATAFRPDILIIDEALSVGDTHFQHKCFARIRAFRENGTTLLFVSHDRSAILGLCERAILLDHGRMLKDDAPDTVMDYYNALIASRESETISTRQRADGRVATRSGGGQASITGLSLQDMHGKSIEIAAVGAKVRLVAEITVKQAIERLVFGYAIKNRIGQTVFGTNTHYSGQSEQTLLPGEKVTVTVDFRMDIAAGDYTVTTALSGDETHLSTNYEWQDVALVFSVANLNHPPFDGLAYLPPHIDVQRSGPVAQRADDPESSVAPASGSITHQAGSR